MATKQITTCDACENQIPEMPARFGSDGSQWMNGVDSNVFKFGEADLCYECHRIVAALEFKGLVKVKKAANKD